MPAAALGRTRRRRRDIAIDPVLGRIFCGDPQTAPPLATFHYGFSADMGGGEYDRAATLDAQATPIEFVPVAARDDSSRARRGASRRRRRDLRQRPLRGNAGGRRRRGEKVELRAANEHRPTIIFSAAVLDISGGAQAEVTLNGLLLAGGALRVASTPGNELRRLHLRHCTLAPIGSRV